MKSGVVDTVFADPPFNIGKDYKNGYVDAAAQTEYLAWCRRWILECCRILKLGCRSQTDPSSGPLTRKRHYVVGNRHCSPVGP